MDELFVSTQIYMLKSLPRYGNNRKVGPKEVTRLGGESHHQWSSVLIKPEFSVTFSCDDKRVISKPG
jgi:hypothetical protein